MPVATLGELGLVACPFHVFSSQLIDLLHPGLEFVSDGESNLQRQGSDGLDEQAANGSVRVAYNDLLVLAERQGVGFNVPLRVIQYRLGNTFEGAVLR